VVRAALCDEAMRLTRSLTVLMPDEPEAWGLLALMLLQHSRRHARVGADGVPVTLEEQDLSRIGTRSRRDWRLWIALPAGGYPAPINCRPRSPPATRPRPRPGTPIGRRSPNCTTD